MKRGVACKQKGCPQPVFHSASIKVQASLKASKQWVVAVMERVSHRDHQSRVPMVEIRKDLLRYIIERMERLKHHFERAIDIINRLFGIDLEQIAKAHVRFTVNPHGVCERADRILDDLSIIQRLILADTRLVSRLVQSLVISKIGRAAIRSPNPLDGYAVFGIVR